MNGGTLCEDREQRNGFGRKSIYGLPCIVLIRTESEMLAIPLSGNSE